MAGKKTDKKTEKTDEKKTSKKETNIKEILKTGDKDQIYQAIQEHGEQETTPEAITEALNKKYKLRTARGIITFKDNTAKGHTWLQIQTNADDDEWTDYDITAAAHGQKQGEVYGESYMIHEITFIN